MDKQVRVRSWTPEQAQEIRYDLLIVSLGYEKRARFVSETADIQAARKIAFGFTRARVLSYRANQRWFRRNGFDIQETGDDQFQEKVRQVLSACPAPGGRPLLLCVDISSMSRLRIASILAEVTRFDTSISVDFIYTTAKFISPPKEMAQIESAGPVIPQLAGWSSEPERPVVAIFGLGFEYDKAVGALDFIEPAEMWAFEAVSPDKRYDEEARRANSFFWREIPKERRLTYSVADPFDTLVNLESLTFGVIRDCRAVLIPFGPKIFSLCCLLVALMHCPFVAVWRVSSGSHEVPVDQASDGSLLGLRVIFDAGTAALI